MPRALILLICLVVPSFAGAQTPAQQAAFDSAYLAWDAGAYDVALREFLELVQANGTESLHEPIALLTGEWFRSTEISADGRFPAWSPNSRYFAYETGADATRRTHIVRVDTTTGSLQPVAEVQGQGLVFAPDGERVAYLNVPESEQLVAARAELERLSGREAFEQRQRIALMEIESARILVRELASGREQEIAAPDISRALLAYTDGGMLVVAGGPPGHPVIDRVMRVTGEGAPVAAQSEPFAESINTVRPLSGARLLLGFGRDRFGVFDASTGQLAAHDGSSPSPSADARSVVFIRQGDDAAELHVLDVATGATRLVKRADAPIASPALSPDGRRIAFQMMPREDWEVYVIGADGEGEVQVTREIQHDLQPHFLSNDTLLALIGEGRHRRSYVYDLRVALQPEGTAETMAASMVAGTPGRVRVHHNNMVRTVAPEYEWAPSPDGRMLLVVADRDGNTISPERGLTLLDFTHHVTSDALVDRIETALIAEQALRTNGAHAFAPVQPAVADAVADVATARIYGYANDLFQFDSKFITQPGNQKAIEYIAAQLRAWGYEPELQWFEARGVRTANIIAKLPGSANPELIYVVSSHFDSVARGPGADDDSSGTTALLEAARVLKDRPQPATIHFAFFTGEEAGLLGSREYVRRAVANGDRIVGALNNDMIGFANDHRLDNTIRYSNAGIRDIQHAAAFLFTDLITYDAKYYRSTDAAAYYEAYGDIVGGIGSYPILGNPHYHQSHDVLETINQQLVAEVSKTTVATLMLLASSPARLNDVRVTRRGSNAAVTWIAAPESDIREYVVSWGAPGATPQTVHVQQPSATIEGVAAGDIVRVKAVNEHGLESWDWAVAEVPAN